MQTSQQHNSMKNIFGRKTVPTKEHMDHDETTLQTISSRQHHTRKNPTSCRILWMTMNFSKHTKVHTINYKLFEGLLTQ